MAAVFSLLGSATAVWKFFFDKRSTLHPTLHPLVAGLVEKLLAPGGAKPGGTPCDSGVARGGETGGRGLPNEDPPLDIAGTGAGRGEPAEGQGGHGGGLGKEIAELRAQLADQQALIERLLQAGNHSPEGEAPGQLADKTAPADDTSIHTNDDTNTGVP